MKINIPLKTENGYKKFEVEAFPAFEMYGHQFLAHRGIDLKNGRAHYRRQDWRVSEAETGTVLIIGYETFWGAIRASELFLADKGAKAFHKAFNSAKKEASE
jgi:hypothetical protein